MGTRSLTIIKDDSPGKNQEGKDICVLYRQMDGYPSGHGEDLKEFLSDINLVNGISLFETRRIANGMQCLAAQLVAHFKTGPGSFYLYPIDTRNCGEQYIYTVYEKEGIIHLRVQDVYKKDDDIGTIYDGPVKEFSSENISDE